MANPHVGSSEGASMEGVRLAHFALGGIVLASYSASRLPGVPGDTYRQTLGWIERRLWCKWSVHLQVETVASSWLWRVATASPTHLVLPAPAFVGSPGDLYGSSHVGPRCDMRGETENVVFTHRDLDWQGTRSSRSSGAGGSVSPLRLRGHQQAGCRFCAASWGRALPLFWAALRFACREGSGRDCSPLQRMPSRRWCGDSAHNMRCVILRPRYL